MPSGIFLACTTIGLALATPVSAFERTGSTHFSSRLGDGNNNFSAAYDSSSKSFSRTGTLTFENGAKIRYTISGTCAGVEDCMLSGNAVGPMGGRWIVEIALRHQEDGPHAVGTLITPNGNHIAFNHSLAAASTR